MCVSGRPYLCDKEGTRRGAGEPPRLRLDGEPVHAFEELGSFAEQLLVHEHAVVRIDPAMPLEVAALLGCGVTTGLGAVLNTARVPAGASVAVVGCGGVGLSGVQAARICGATRIVAVDTRASKLDAARASSARRTRSTRARATPSSRSSSSPAAASSGPSRRSAPRRRPSRRSACCAPGGTCTVVGVLAGSTVRLDGIDPELGPQDPGVAHGLQPLPDRHPALRRPVPAGPSAARRPRPTAHRARRTSRARSGRCTAAREPGPS